jgi:hypothetical protein
MTASTAVLVSERDHRQRPNFRQRRIVAFTSLMVLCENHAKRVALRRFGPREAEPLEASPKIRDERIQACHQGGARAMLPMA